MMTQHHNNIRLLMEKAGQETPRVPTMPSAAIRKLRATLILEEALETIHGLGFELEGSGGDDIGTDNIKDSGLAPNFLEIVDGCADVSVVTIGTLVACGVDDLEILEEVDQNNLAKFGPGGYRRADGKWVKPPGHPKPDIESILRRQGWKG